jgi:uncharacterized protein (UPF0335 family)
MADANVSFRAKVQSCIVKIQKAWRRYRHLCLFKQMMQNARTKTNNRLKEVLRQLEDSTYDACAKVNTIFDVRKRDREEQIQQQMKRNFILQKKAAAII